MQVERVSRLPRCREQHSPRREDERLKADEPQPRKNPEVDGEPSGDHAVVNKTGDEPDERASAQRLPPKREDHHR